MVMNLFVEEDYAKRKTLEIDKIPYQFKTNALRMKKSYTKPNFDSHTILTDEPFSYVEFYFNTKAKKMKYREKAESKKKYGDEKKYHYFFYWKQAKHF